MSTITAFKKELPELEFPLDYPACLDRIVQAAENRANYEIAISYLERLFIETVENEMNAKSHDCWIYNITKMFFFNKATSASAKAFLSSRNARFLPLVCFETESECDDFSQNHIKPKL